MLILFGQPRKENGLVQFFKSLQRRVGLYVTALQLLALAYD